MIDITPSTNSLRGRFATNLTTRIALCEWIDNALDAGAKQVRIAFGPSRGGRPTFVSVEDDGSGVADLSSLARDGDHRAGRATRSGIYGVGAKDAAFYFGDERSRYMIESTCGGRRRRLVVDWQAIIELERWQIPDQTEEDADPTSHTGTKVTVMPVAARIPDGKAWEDLLSDVAYTYTPALKRGVQIQVMSKKRQTAPTVLQPWRLPELQPGHVDELIDVGGKTARVYAGIVAEGVLNPRPGITYLHEYRVLIPASAKGCGAHSPARIAGFVEVIDTDGKKWVRNRNKDGFKKNAEELYASVESVLTPLLERAARQGAQLRSAAFAKAVEGLINTALNDAKAKRDRGAEHGTVDPKHTNIRHRDAKEKQRGATMPRNRYGAIRIEFDHLGDVGAGRMHSNGVVVLNLDAPAIDVARRNENTLATASFACSIIASDHAIRGDEPTLKLNLRSAREGEDAVNTFSRVLGELLSAAADLDGRSVLEEAAE